MTAKAPYELSHHRSLEAESIFIIRELVAQCERPVLLFSGGKDSVVLLRLAEKALAPAPLPFPLLQIDTGHNFPEVITFRDQVVRDRDLRLMIASVQEAIDAGKVTEDTGLRASRNRLQTVPLLEAIQKNRFDAVLGGARRDEEKARAKERVFSFRDEMGQWDPRNQRPEPWALYSARHKQGEHIRAFPLSNWTELDVWQYAKSENLALPSLYFAHERNVFRRDGMLMADTPCIRRQPSETTFKAKVRYRTVGDMTCTGAVESSADSYDAIIEEVKTSRITERGASRADDKVSEMAMEDRKREGYF